MKEPAKPPDWQKLFNQLIEERKDVGKIIGAISLTHRGRYLHWHKLRYLKPPSGMSSEQWWVALKLARLGQMREIPLCDVSGDPFRFAITDQMMEYLHRIDQGAGGHIETIDSTAVNPKQRDRYIVHSLIEEAITSSQLEGATTTRRVAKEMLRTERPPRDRSEQMILNNYITMRLIRQSTSGPLTKERILGLHRHLTEDTLDDPDAVGRFRKDTEEIKVYETMVDHILHTPPPAEELDLRVGKLCGFANGTIEGGFIHPVIRAIILHFWLAYDHPFVDGNGRCARALFYWMMLHQGQDYWLCEYISISQIIGQGPARYGRAFLYTENDNNDLTYFILYHLEIIDRAVRELHDYIGRRIASLRKTERLLRSSSLDLNFRQLSLLGHALRHPDTTYTIGTHQKNHRVVHQTARSDLLDLVSKGLLEKRRTGRAFAFSPTSDLDEKIGNKHG